MKRFSDGNMGGPYKRSRVGPDDIEVRLLIPSKVAGSIIGKGGKNISRLRSDFKASVTVPDCPGPERILTVSAPEVETVIKVVTEVLPNLEDASGRSKSGDDVDIRMLVHQSQAGCIIGKGGLKVKELREKTGARIKIYTSCCPQSTDRVVQITGRGNTVDCVQEMVELLKSVPVKGADNPYDPINFDELYADDYGGYGSSVGGGGGGGRGGMGMGRDMGGPPMGGRDMGGRDMGRGRPAPFGGPPARGPGGMGGPPQRAGFGGSGFGGGGGSTRNGFDGPPMGMGRGGMRMNGPGHLRNTGLGPRTDGPGFNPMRNDGYNDGPTDSDNIDGPTQSQVTIPKDLAGAIIGKGGARIRKIRSESGAGITIEEPLPGSSDRVITITGLPNQIQMAQYLLQRSVHENTNVGRDDRY